MNTIKDVLEQARSIVANGWHKGGNTNGDGSYCLRAAIGLAAGVYEDEFGEIIFKFPNAKTESWQELRDSAQRMKTDLAATKVVLEHLPSPFQSIPVFNDSRATSRDDVLAVLDKAIGAC